MHVGELCGRGVFLKRGDRTGQIPKRERRRKKKTRQNPEELGLGESGSVHYLTTRLTSLSSGEEKSLLRPFQVIKVSRGDDKKCRCDSEE